MDRPAGDLRERQKRIGGTFLFSSRHPKENARKSTSYWELNLERGSLEGYDLETKKIIFIAPTIKSVIRNRYDKEYFCVDCGTDYVEFAIFLICINESVADEWEIELCRLTGQHPTNIRRRPVTDVDAISNKPSYARSTTRVSAPSASHGFQNPLPTITTNNSSAGQREMAGSVRLEAARDGQREPQEHHIGCLPGCGECLTFTGDSDCVRGATKLGHDVTCPFCHSSLDRPDSPDSHPSTFSCRECATTKYHADRPLLVTVPSDDTRHMDDIPQSLPLSAPGDLRSITSPEAPDKLKSLRRDRDRTLTIMMKKDLLMYMDLRFGQYDGNIFVVGSKNSMMETFNVGDCIVQINGQKPDDTRSATDYIRTSADDEVSFLVWPFPVGRMVTVDVSSREELGIVLEGNEITFMDIDKSVGRACDSLHVWASGKRSTQSITTINAQPVPFNSPTKQVEAMLQHAIDRPSDGGIRKTLVLHLHPTVFLRKLDPEAYMTPTLCLREGDIVNTIRRPYRIRQPLPKLAETE